MLSVTYPIAGDMDIESYVRMLYRQGNMKFRSRDVSVHLDALDSLRGQVVEAVKGHHYDLAYAKCARIIHIDDVENLRSKCTGADKKRLENTLRFAIDTMQTLRASHLARLLQQQITQLRDEEAERKKIIALQMEVEPEDADEDDEEERLRHEERRQRLLSTSSTPEYQAPPSTAKSDANDGDEFYKQRQERLRKTQELQASELEALLTQGKRSSYSREDAASLLSGILPAAIPRTQTTPLVTSISEAAPAPVNLLGNGRTTAVALPASQQPTPSPPLRVTDLPTRLPSNTSPQLTPASARHPPQVSPQQHAPMQSPASAIGPITLSPSLAQGPPRGVTTPVMLERRLQQWKYDSLSNPRRRGLINLGNTCYMNSVLQCLAQTELGIFVTSSEFADVLDTGRGGLVRAFSFLMLELGAETSAPVNAARLKAEVASLNESFAGKSQQDANEFLRTLLDGMHEELNTAASNKARCAEIDNATGSDEEIAKQYWTQYRQKNQSPIVNLFVFQEKSSIMCPCGNNPRSFSPIVGVELPIPTLGRPVSIEDCFAAYCQRETLDANSLYSCSRCKKKTSATKQLSFHTLPRNLVVTLKRFRSYGNFSDKVQTSVAFQRELDLAPFLGAQNVVNTRYRLIGAVNHQGNIHGGHYTADCMSMRDGLWYYCSDEVVREATEPSFKLAYTLFYMVTD